MKYYFLSACVMVVLSTLVVVDGRVSDDSFQISNAVFERVGASIFETFATAIEGSLTKDDAQKLLERTERMYYSSGFWGRKRILS